jgi:hypothetical protein
MNTADITIINRGRGEQLSTSRIMVRDLVPYFQEGCEYEEIIRWIPSLTREEIAVVDAYYREHQTELDEQERRFREYQEERVRAQRERFPEEEREERAARMRRILRERRQEANGARNPG